MPSSSSKGNPAHTRMSNANRKARKQRSWLHGEARKEHNRDLQHQREVANRHRTGPTPWQQAKAARRARHEAEKAAGRWRAAQRDDLGFILRLDATGRPRIEDPGVKERKRWATNPAYLEEPPAPKRREHRMAFTR